MRGYDSSDALSLGTSWLTRPGTAAEHYSMFTVWFLEHQGWQRTLWTPHATWEARGGQSTIGSTGIVALLSARPSCSAECLYPAVRIDETDETKAICVDSIV